MPASQVTAGALGQRRQRGSAGTQWRWGFDRVERAAEQIGGHDAGGPRADMNAQRHEWFVVDLHRHAGATNSPRNCQICALAQQTRVEQRDDLAVHRCDAQ